MKNIDNHRYSTTLLGLVNNNPALQTFMGNEAARNEKKAIDSFTPEEAKVIVFYPTLITLVGFEYIRTIVDRCVKSKMPFVKEVREIKKAKAEYLSRCFSGVKSEHKEMIIDSVDSIFEGADKNIDTLWKVTQHVILKKHPNMDNAMQTVTANAVIAILFLRMAIKIAKICEHEIEKRTDTHSNSLVDIYTIRIINTCISMIAKYQIPYTASMSRSIKAIARKVSIELKRRINNGKI